MKSSKSTSLILLLVAMMFCTSCDDFLTPKPVSFISSDNFYQTPDDFERALIGVYNRLRTQVGVSSEQFMYFSEVQYDAINRQFNPSNPTSGMVVEEWHLITSNPFLQTQWQRIYTTISQANMILARIDNAAFQHESQRARIKGEAKFMRALSYWYAVQWWGAVPIVAEEVRTPDEVVPLNGRRPTSEVYALIIADLQEAIAGLPPTATQPGRVTQGAANFLLGRTFLITGNYRGAVDALKEVESNYGFQLLPNFADIWNPARINHAESIFELQFGANVTGQPHADMIRRVLPWTARGQIVANQVNTTGWYHPSLDLIEMFEDRNSNRFNASIMWWERAGNANHPDVTFYGDSLAIIKKFFWPDHLNSQGQQAGNIILFRYADALLSLAEAYWRDDPAANQTLILNLLNSVRHRAGLPNVDLANVPMPQILQGTYLEQDALGRAIFNERTVELFAEGHRAFDLARFGVALEVMTNYAQRRKEREPRLLGFLEIQPYKFLLPIPDREMSLTGFEQNPGW